MKLFLTLFVVLLVSNANGVEWNVWDTPNFEVWSVDRSQGEYVKSNIELTRDWIYTRWGLKSTRFPVRCKVWITPNKELMNSLFHLTEGSFTKVERDASGNITKADIFILLDKNESIASPLTIVCLAEANKPFPFWAVRGMSNLDLSVPQIRAKIGFKPNKTFPLKTILSITRDQWMAMPAEDKTIFDLQATDFCLMLRKEYGQDICLQTMRENSLNSMGFSSFEAVDNTLRRYMNYVADDIQSNRMPNSYLTIMNKDN